MKPNLSTASVLAVCSAAIAECLFPVSTAIALLRFTTSLLIAVALKLASFASPAILAYASTLTTDPLSKISWSILPPKAVSALARAPASVDTKPSTLVILSPLSRSSCAKPNLFNCI